MVNADSAFMDFTRRLGILASGDFSVEPEMFHRIVTENVQGTPIDTYTQVNDIFLQNVRMYVLDTNQSLLYNDVTNANQYLKDTMTKEIDRYSTVRDRTFNSIHKTRYSYMGKKYDIEYNRFVAVLLQFTIFVVVLMALVMGAQKHLVKDNQWFTMQLALIVCAAILLFYTLVALMFFKQNQLRRKDDWNKYYFPSRNDSKGSGKSCS